MDKNALVISKRLKFPKNDRTDKNIIAQPIMNTYTFGTKLKQLAITQNPRVSMKTSPTGRVIKY